MQTKSSTYWEKFSEVSSYTVLCVKKVSTACFPVRELLNVWCDTWTFPADSPSDLIVFSKLADTKRLGLMVWVPSHRDLHGLLIQNTTHHWVYSRGRCESLCLKYALKKVFTKFLILVIIFRILGSCNVFFEEFQDLLAFLIPQLLDSIISFWNGSSDAVVINNILNMFHLKEHVFLILAHYQQLMFFN